MSNDEFQEAVEITAARAPRNWTQLRIRFRYFDATMDIDTRFQTPSSSDREHFDVGSFDLMDWFDAYYKRVAAKLAEPWSVVTRTVDRERRIMVEYDYSDPGILNR